VATGSGDSLGAAIKALVASVSYGRARTSYTAKTIPAQLRALTGTVAGRAAADRAGLAPSRRTLLGWLSEQQAPNAANRARIREAYASLQKGFNRAALQRDLRLSGVVATGPRDRRNRGADGHMPLLIDGSAGNWDRIEQLWNWDAVPSDFEDAFIYDVIREDDALGEGSDGWDFPGSSYSVST
jgi:hypothetical protein